MNNEIVITDENTLVQAVDYYGLLPFWTETEISAWTLCRGISFNKFWDLRFKPINDKRVVYGKFWNKKAAFVSKEFFPYLAALRRDGYDFDSLSDEGRVSHAEFVIMNAVGTGCVPSYKLGQTLNIKGYETALTSLQTKTYLCNQFGKSYMGTALIAMPETIFGEDYVRSAYSKTVEENAQILSTAKIFADLDEKTVKKILSPAVF